MLESPLQQMEAAGLVYGYRLVMQDEPTMMAGLLETGQQFAEQEQKRKDHYADIAKRISAKNWRPADQAKSFPEPRFLQNYGEAMQPHVPDPPTREGVAKKKEQLKKKGGHEKPWRAVPGGISTRPVISVVEKDLSRQYRGKV